MKFPFFLLSTGVLALQAQVATTPPTTPKNPFVPAPTAAAPNPETVIATVDGQKLIYAELQSFLAGMSPEMQQSAMRDRKELVRRYGMMRRLSHMAEESKLDQKTPYKEALASSRTQILTNARIQEEYLAIPVSADDQKKFYDQNKGRYEQVKLRIVYIAFTGDEAAKASGKKFHTEAEAKAKAEDVVKQARAGVDFAKLVQDYSEDEKSKAQKGDFGVIHRSDNLPEDIRSVVFALKQGQVSDPLRQRNGFYVFRADEVAERAYAEVKDDIYNELKQARLRTWLDGLAKGIPVKLEDESFFK